MKKKKRNKWRIAIKVLYVICIILTVVAAGLITLGIKQTIRNPNTPTVNVVEKQENNFFVMVEDTKKKTTKPIRQYFSEEEMALFEKVVYAEASTDYEEQISVAATILNRMESPDFPNQLYEVIFQPGAFDSAMNGDIYTGVQTDSPKVITKEMIRNEGSTAREAVTAALEGEDPAREALEALGEENLPVYFYAPDACSEEALKERSTISKKVQIGKQIFYATWD